MIDTTEVINILSRAFAKILKVINAGLLILTRALRPHRREIEESVQWDVGLKAVGEVPPGIAALAQAHMETHPGFKFKDETAE